MASDLVTVAKDKGKPQKLTAASKIMVMDPREMARDATPIFVGADVNPVAIKAQKEGKPQAALFANDAPSTQEVWDKMQESYGLFPDLNIYGEFKPQQGYQASDNAIENFNSIEKMLQSLSEQIYGRK